MAINIINQRFNRLIAVKFHHKDKNRQHHWIFKCDCGKEKVIIKTCVVNNKVKSCGCLRRETAKKSGQKNKIHGMRYSTFYRAWIGIKNRCLNNRTKPFPGYGGRGIRICDRWLKFNNFKDDMYNSYLDHIKKYGVKNTSIDRIDNNGNYCPENCRWATWKEQNGNRKNNVILLYNGKKQIINNWAKELGFKRECLKNRLKRGWSVEKTLTTPLMLNKYTFK